MFNKFFRLIRTLFDLKFKQIYYRIFYFLKKRSRFVLQVNNDVFKAKNFIFLGFDNDKWFSNSLVKKNEFSFLNLSVVFTENIDWHFSEHGKLWLYNLGYFEFLKNIDEQEGTRLLLDFYNSTEQDSVLREAYPTSLRNINVIKFISHHKVENRTIINNLYTDFHFLKNNLEYHLLGNHLLENIFSLIWCSFFFQQNKSLEKAVELLHVQLKEQILEDGGHFELSPMYHQIILYRLLDIISLYRRNGDSAELNLLEEYAGKMISWLSNMTYNNGDIPLFSDSAYKVAPDTKFLKNYFQNLGIKYSSYPLGASGYRKYSSEKYELYVDVGEIGPRYLPAHGHSDCLSFELSRQGKRVICDAGVGTYEPGEIRSAQRSTRYHNTVEISNQDQSEVWHSFRVGRKAIITELIEDNNFLQATHDGYKHLNCFHTRKFNFESNRIVITDIVKGQHAECKAYFHLLPGMKLKFNKDKTIDIDGINVSFNKGKISSGSYNYSEVFNRYKESKVLIVSFANTLTTIIKF